MADLELQNAFLAPWGSEPDPGGEGEWTSDGEGWKAWNPWSPEKEFCEFAAALALLVRPALTVETGVGQGYVTRRLAAVLPGRYIGYESDDDLRDWLRELDLWSDTVELATESRPTADVFAQCNLAILDSARGYRRPEIDLWREHAPAGGYVLVHDARPDHPVEDGGWRRLAEYLGDEGVFLGHPRGSWLYRKPLPQDPPPRALP